MFLTSRASHAFSILNDDPGLAAATGSDFPAMVFPIQDGHIQGAPAVFSRYVGMPRDVFLEELRALSRAR